MRMRLPDALMRNGLRRLLDHTDDSFAGLAAALTHDLLDAAAVRASAQNVAGVGADNGSALSTALSALLPSVALPQVGAGAGVGWGGGGSSSGGGGGVGGGDAGGGSGGVGGGSLGWLTRQVITFDYIRLHPITPDYTRMAHAAGDCIGVHLIDTNCHRWPLIASECTGCTQWPL